MASVKLPSKPVDAREFFHAAQVSLLGVTPIIVVGNEPLGFFLEYHKLPRVYVANECDDSQFIKFVQSFINSARSRSIERLAQSLECLRESLQFRENNRANFFPI